MNKYNKLNAEKNSPFFQCTMAKEVNSGELIDIQEKRKIQAQKAFKRRKNILSFLCFGVRRF